MSISSCDFILNIYEVTFNLKIVVESVLFRGGDCEIIGAGWFSLREEKIRVIKIFHRNHQFLADNAPSLISLTLSDIVIGVSAEYFIRMLIAEVLFRWTLLETKEE